MIGGGGERKTLRLVARYGDACNLFASSPDDVAHKLEVLRRHCDDAGRDYGSIRKTIMANNPRPTPETRDEFVRAMADYAALGVDTVIVTPPTAPRRRGSTPWRRRCASSPTSDLSPASRRKLAPFGRDSQDFASARERFLT